MVQAILEVVSQENNMVTLRNKSTNNSGAHSDVSWVITQPKYTIRTGGAELAKTEGHFIGPSPLFKKGQVVKFSTNRDNANADFYPILEGPYVVVLIARDTFVQNGFTTSRNFFAGVEIGNDNKVIRTYNNEEILAKKFHLLCNDAKAEEISAAKSAVQREAVIWFRANGI